MESYSEDAFYENLTLGLVKILENIPGVCNVNLEKKPPCDRMQISTWEQRHSCVLPNDMKHFYLSVDGFKLTWSYEYADEVLPIGHMKINALADLKRLGGVKCQGDADRPTLLDIEMCNLKSDLNRPYFSLGCKIFEIDSCEGNGRVCLVYMDKYEVDIERREKPKIWFLDRSFEWHFLADSFTKYFRMMLVHQGLPQWQFRFTTMGLTQFAEQLMVLLAPHLLQTSNTSTVSDWPSADNGPINQVDPGVFRAVREKGSKKKETKAESPT